MWLVPALISGMEYSEEARISNLMGCMYNTCPIQISKRNPRNPPVWRRSLPRIKRIFRPKRRKNKSAKEEICLASGHRRGLAFLGQPFQISESERGLQERERERERREKEKEKEKTREEEPLKKNRRNEDLTRDPFCRIG